MYHFTISHLLISALVEFTFCIDKCLNQIKEMLEMFVFIFYLCFWLWIESFPVQAVSLPFLPNIFNVNGAWPPV